MELSNIEEIVECARNGKLFVLVDDENEYRIRLHLIVNYELKMLILSYGSSVRVISPSPLEKQIRAELENTLQQY